MFNLIRIVLFLTLCIACLHGTATAQQVRDQPAFAANPVQVLSAYEREQIRLEEAKLALEREKAWVTAGALAIPLIAAILAYWSARKNQLDQAKANMKLQESVASDNFVLKACEIAMSGRTSYDAKGKAVALAALFPGKLPADLGRNFDAKGYEWGREAPRELFALIAAHAEHRRIIVRAYKALFPHDDWINRLPEDL
jgi:hypothetical protein